MATTLFKDTTYSAFGLIEDIKQVRLRCRTFSGRLCGVPRRSRPA